MSIDLEKREPEATTAGNYFISNYPPYSFWRSDAVAEAQAALDTAPRPDTPLGVYVHIPFCRKRCHFCYFKVYTSQNSQAVRDYLECLLTELRALAKRAFIGGRKPKFVYFGGGTPSYLSSAQLTWLTNEMKAILPWDEVEEVTFECEPGTLTEKKVAVLRELGVTRLSLGVENFEPRILELNGRAHRGKEIHRAYGWAKDQDFPQINIDLIAGMLDETDDNWRDCVQQAIGMEADSVTIYQMEIPFNTTIYQQMKERSQLVAPVADWGTKRRWLAEAFTAFEAAGYDVASAYTVVRDQSKTRFVYRDELWRGADLVGLGVASFGHVNGTHYQNIHGIKGYQDAVHDSASPIYRALTPDHEELWVREFILQLKLGHLSPTYFQEKYGIDVWQAMAGPLTNLEERGYLAERQPELRLTREALLQVDQLLHGFFLPRHRNARYA